MRQIPLNLMSLYADIAQRAALVDVPPASISVKSVDGKKHLYAVTKDGSTRRQSYIGSADNVEAQNRAEAHRRAARMAGDLRRSVMALRRSGLRGPTIEVGRLLEALANAGFFELGATLVGTVAFQQFPPIVGAYLSEGAALTEDADFAFTRFIVPRFMECEPLEDILRRADPTFKAHFNFEDKLPKAFVSERGLKIELLTSRGRTDGPVPIKGLACAAVPLRFMEYLLEDTMEVVALYGPGVRVRVPDPARYAVHKLIVTQLRQPHSPKRPKDLQQARELFAALRAREPETLDDAIDNARARGATWRRMVDKGLALLDKPAR
jgi:hypothetical protein